MRSAASHPALRNLGHITRLGPLGWLDLLRASLELARARLRFGKRSARDLLEAARDSRALSTTDGLSEAQLSLARRVAYAIPRVGDRLPWRADCLVQALAAQHWLGRNGIATHLYVGVRNHPPKGFESHAWLILGELIVTGGDCDGFTPMIAPVNA